MHFQSLAVLSLAAFTIAAPTPAKRQSGPVLADTTYNDISIAGGQAGNAEAEALAVFSALDLQNPGNIDPADIKFLGEVNNVANDAEVSAFNPAVEAATGDEADQIQNGKIKNKVLKLMATKIELEAKQAQGEDVADKLAAETTKLNNNIATDTKNAGQTSIAEPFNAVISGGGNVAAGAANGNNNAASTGSSAATGNISTGEAANGRNGAQNNVAADAVEDAEAEDAGNEDDNNNNN
ncbi:hypothetical protein ACN47E_001345 [Coniothyrium glycines]